MGVNRFANDFTKSIKYLKTAYKQLIQNKDFNDVYFCIISIT